jgi:hypothetical protein
MLENLKNNTLVKIRYDCNGDYNRCGKEFFIKWKDANKNFIKNHNKHICRSCSLKKNNPMFDQKIIEKVKKPYKFDWKLDDISDEHTRKVVYILLKNQVKYNDISFKEYNCYGIGKKFLKISLPIVKEIFKNLIINDIVSIQPTTQPTGSVYYYKTSKEDSDEFSLNVSIEHENISVNTKKFNTPFMLNIDKEILHDNNLILESNIIKDFIYSIKSEIDRQIINDIIFNAGIEMDLDFSIVDGKTVKEKSDYLYHKIMEISSIIYKNILTNYGNFIITSIENISILETRVDFEKNLNIDESYGIKFYGILNKQFKVYQDVLFPKDLILMGYSGKDCLKI